MTDEMVFKFETEVVESMTDEYCSALYNITIPEHWMDGSKVEKSRIPYTCYVKTLLAGSPAGAVYGKDGLLAWVSPEIRDREHGLPERIAVHPDIVRLARHVDGYIDSKEGEDTRPMQTLINVLSPTRKDMLEESVMKEIACGIEGGMESIPFSIPSFCILFRHLILKSIKGITAEELRRTMNSKRIVKDYIDPIMEYLEDGNEDGREMIIHGQWIEHPNGEGRFFAHDVSWVGDKSPKLIMALGTPNKRSIASQGVLAFLGMEPYPLLDFFGDIYRHDITGSYYLTEGSITQSLFTWIDSLQVYLAVEEAVRELEIPVGSIHIQDTNARDNTRGRNGFKLVLSPDYEYTLVDGVEITPTRRRRYIQEYALRIRGMNGKEYDVSCLYTRSHRHSYHLNKDDAFIARKRTEGEKYIISPIGHPWTHRSDRSGEKMTICPSCDKPLEVALHTSLDTLDIEPTGSLLECSDVYCPSKKEYRMKVFLSGLGIDLPSDTKKWVLDREEMKCPLYLFDPYLACNGTMEGLKHAAIIRSGMRKLIMDIDTPNRVSIILSSLKIPGLSCGRLNVILDKNTGFFGVAKYEKGGSSWKVTMRLKEIMSTNRADEVYRILERMAKEYSKALYRMDSWIGWYRSDYLDRGGINHITSCYRRLNILVDNDQSSDAFKKAISHLKMNGAICRDMLDTDKVDGVVVSPYDIFLTEGSNISSVNAVVMTPEEVIRGAI